jgi:hypothetical protein
VPEAAPSWASDDDDLPDWQGPATAPVWTGELPAAAPVPPPVPATDRAAGTWDVAGMPVRPAATARPARQRLTAELPDLDDELFDADDDRVIHPEPAARRDERPIAGMPGTVSPRESFFRASRYPHQERAVSAAPEPAGTDMESPLPDLGGDRLDVRDVVAQGAELIDRRIEVAPDIPRTCRTCRSFRSADGGARGWCTNEWAFTHRRMVNDDDLACVSAIGCWWLPADHLRLDLDDVTEDVRTPRMDELIAGDRPAARRVSGE